MTKEKQANIKLSLLELQALCSTLLHYELTHTGSTKGVRYCETLRHKLFKAQNALKKIK